MPPGNCAICRTGNVCRMNAGARGAAFGSGALLGAFVKPTDVITVVILHDVPKFA